MTHAVDLELLTMTTMTQGKNDRYGRGAQDSRTAEVSGVLP